MYRSLKERGRAAADYYAGRPEYFSLSPAGLSLLKALQPVVKDFCRGRVLDAGAGRGVYKSFLSSYAEDYVGMDVIATASTNVLGDIQRLPFADGTFDTVFCSQVLEHVPEPGLALAELGRVLKPGGTLILTVPHICWLHNEPSDFFRFTHYGLRHLLCKAGWVEAQISPVGGLFSLFGHILSTLLINCTFGMGGLHLVAKGMNLGAVRLAVLADRYLEKKKLFALNYVCLAHKPVEAESE